MHEARFGRWMRAVVVVVIVVILGCVGRSGEKQSIATPTGGGSLEVFQPVAAWMVINNNFDGGGVRVPGTSDYYRDPRTGILFHLGKYWSWTKPPKGNGFEFKHFTIGGKTYAPDSGGTMWVDIIGSMNLGRSPTHRFPIGEKAALQLLPCDERVEKCYSDSIRCIRKLHPLLEVRSIMTYWAGVNLYSNSPFQEIAKHPYLPTHNFSFKDSVRVNIYKLEGKNRFVLTDTLPQGQYQIRVEYREHEAGVEHHGLNDDPPWP